MRRLELTIKEKMYEQTHRLLRTVAVIRRYGSHLKIVMIFLTQNNLKRSRNFQPFPWNLTIYIARRVGDPTVHSHTIN